MKLCIPEKALKQHIAVLGKTGSGKTSTEKLVVEHVVSEGFRVCVLDTIKSDWWGITSSSDGKKPGLDFKILGGPRGHVPLHANAGKVIGQIVGSGKLRHSIIDMADFEAGGIQKFFTEFAPSLMRNAKGVLYLVIEEAHEVAPKERAGFGAENLAIHWAKKLATAGRSKGIRLIVATQRVQSLHNAVLGSCETIIAHRLTTPADQEPVLKWLKANTDKAKIDEVSATLSSLGAGVGWVCSGEAKFFELVKFPKFSTYDNTSTPTGDSVEMEIKTSPVDHNELKAIIGEAVDEAKANDPAELKRTIAGLRKEISVLQKATPALKVEVKEVPMLSKDERELLNRFSASIAESSEALKSSYANIQAGLVATHELIGRISAQPQRAEARRLSVLSQRQAAPVTSRPVSPVSNGESIGGGMRRMMIALAQRGGLTKRQLGVRAGLSSSSGTFGTYLAKLRTNGWLNENGGTMALSDAGVEALGHYEPLPEGRALYEYWKNSSMLGGGASRMLEALVEYYPNPMTKDELGERAGISHTSGTFGTYLAKLRTLDLVTGKHELLASAELCE